MSGRVNGTRSIAFGTMGWGFWKLLRNFDRMTSPLTSMWKLGFTGSVDGKTSMSLTTKSQSVPEIWVKISAWTFPATVKSWVRVSVVKVRTSGRSMAKR